MLRRSWLRVVVVSGVCAAVVVGGVCAMVVLPASAASGASSAKPKTFGQVLDVPSITASASACTAPEFDLPDKVPMRIESIIVRMDGAEPSDFPRASLSLTVKFDESTVRAVHIPIPLNVPNGFGGASGRVELGDIVVTELPFADVAIGQPFAAGYVPEPRFGRLGDGGRAADRDQGLAAGACRRARAPGAAAPRADSLVEEADSFVRSRPLGAGTIRGVHNLRGVLAETLRRFDSCQAHCE